MPLILGVLAAKSVLIPVALKALAFMSAKGKTYIYLVFRPDFARKYNSICLLRCHGKTTTSGCGIF